ncbi:hypothetical protein L1987_60073 [Smallanthus sonchifolius]|uniref:Uncharacterized protein n=1 Tax=Smallanthus sonchifolius TaxID=185202 RepID=A0ACB9D7G3_9ASTR|nr:hypothetical protein L1987_60073 [Smallanthus sonchifolius]
MENLQNLGKLLNYVNEIGTPQKPPKLLNVNDYSNWKARFEHYISYTDSSLWIPILEGYKHPTYTYLDEIVPNPIFKLDEEEKKVYDRKKKAHGSITMALTRELFHSFKGYDNSKDLWKALQKRFEGNSDIKKRKRDLLRKKYECFRYLENESIDELISRFYHLQTELKAFELKYPDEELVENFLDALPPKFKMYTTLLRENPKFYEMTIEEAIGKVQAHDMNLKRKESLGRPQIQDLSMYYGTSSTAKSSGSGIALFSGNSHEEDNSNGCGGHTCFTASRSAKDHVALFSSCMLAYENFIGGKLTDPKTIEEDFNQVDPDDMEDMDIQWNIAMILRRAKRFLNRTGRKFIGGYSNAKDKAPALGFTRPSQGNNQGNNQGYNNSNNHNQGQGGTSNALIVEMMEAEKWEASVADQEESTTAFSLMAVGEASSSSTEVDSNSFAVISCSKCLGLKEENSKLQDKVEPLRIAALSYKENEKLVRQVNGLGLGTNAITPPVSGKFFNGLIDIDLSCLDESLSQDDSSNKDDSSSKADSASDKEFFTDEGSENTIPDGAVSEELIGEHKVVKNTITDHDNCILTEPDTVETNEKLKVGVIRILTRRIYKEKRACFHCGMVGHILVNCPAKNQGKRPIVSQPAVISKSPPVKQPKDPNSNMVKPPVKPMVKPKITTEAKPSVPKREKQPAKPCVSISGSAPTGEASSSSPGASECKPTVPVKQKKRSWNKKSKISQSPGPKDIRRELSLIVGEKGGNITCQGVDSNGCVSFDNVNYCVQIKHNLLSVSQMCDKEYSIDMNVAKTTSSVDTCLLTKATEIDSILWHRKLGHVFYQKMNHLVRNGLVTGVPKLRFSVADDCTKDETTNILQYLILSLESLCKLKVRRIRSDNGTEFKNNLMELFCLKKGIRHEFSAPYTPQQNGVAERKNRTLIETARTMLSNAKIPDRKSKFHAKAVEGIFLGYVANSPCKRVYNIGTRTVEVWFEVDYSKHIIPPEPTGPAWGFDYDALFKSFNLPDLSADDAANVFDFFNGGDDSNFSTRATVPIVTPDSNAASASGTHDSEDVEVVHVDGNDAPADPNTRVGNEAPADPINIESSSSGTMDMGELNTNLDTNLQEPHVPEMRVHKNHPIDNIIGDPHAGVQTRHRTIAENTNLYAEILDTVSWKLVCILEAIRLFLAYASYVGFKVYQLDVKSAFLYGKVHEEVYVTQPPGFEDPRNINKVYKLDKALYGLHQAPRAWYETLSKHLLSNGFDPGQIDSTLFIRKAGGDILLIQVYVDDIIFRSTNEEMCREFEQVMKSKSEMSNMGELSFFLCLQVSQREDGIYLHQTNTYGTPILVNHGLHPGKDGKDVDCKLYRGMIGSLMYLTASRPDIMFAQSFDFKAYTDSDYGGCNLDRKSTSGGCQLFGDSLVSWQCKKQSTVSVSTCEAEYIAVASEMNSDGGDEEEGGDGAEESDSEATESDSSDSNDAPDQTHPQRMAKVSHLEPSSKRQRQESSNNKYVPEHETGRRKNRTIQGFPPKSFYIRHFELLTWSTLAILALVSRSSNLT